MSAFIKPRRQQQQEQQQQYSRSISDISEDSVISVQNAQHNLRPTILVTAAVAAGGEGGKNHHDDDDDDDDDDFAQEQSVLIVPLNDNADDHNHHHHHQQQQQQQDGIAGAGTCHIRNKKRKFALVLLVPFVVAILIFQLDKSNAPPVPKSSTSISNRLPSSSSLSSTAMRIGGGGGEEEEEEHDFKKIKVVFEEDDDMNDGPLSLDNEAHSMFDESEHEGPLPQDHHQQQQQQDTAMTIKQSSTSSLWSNPFKNILHRTAAAAAPRASSPSSLHGRSAQSESTLLLKSEERPLPFRVDRTEKVSTSTTTPAAAAAAAANDGLVVVKKQSAADALMCRESVLNYVINATNGKDECTGLQKAFDETCSQEEDDDEDQEEFEQQAQSSLETVADISLGKETGGNGNGRRRRLLTRRRQEQKWRNRKDMWTYYSEKLEGYAQVIQSWWFPKPLFYPENAVLFQFSKARRKEITKRQRRRLEQQQGDFFHVSNLDRSRLSAKSNTTSIDHVPPPSNDNDDDEAFSAGMKLADTSAGVTGPEVEQTQAPIKLHPKPHNILNLPTGHSHVTGKTLESTLLLQHEEKVIHDVIKKANTTVTANATATTKDPKEDFAASAKAVADTSELVSQLLNDPTSVEARACCASILNVYHENCNVDAEEDISDQRLFIVVLIMAFCGMIKSLIRHFKIRWLPEAAGCILVGVVSGYVASYFPHQDFSFDGNWFLRILVPPIVFEASLSIDKRTFNRHLVPIMFFATVGTLLATLLTASIVHAGTKWLGGFCETIPYIESLIFGALISSIDPIAVLSVLSNMGMSDTDTLYVLVFGESLLNDGVAMVLFQTLERFLDANMVIDNETITAAVVHFFVVACGSILVGAGSGMMCALYYWGFHGCQTPLVEVLMFLCWALFPYYVCDGIGWSGIVSIVTMGFMMDMYVVGANDDDGTDSEYSHHDLPQNGSREIDNKIREKKRARPIFSGEGHLSTEARTHIGFVTEIVATMMETAIFAYLGLFLFSQRYHWNGFHIMIAIAACCVSRAIMIPILSMFANMMTAAQKYQNKCRGGHKNTPAMGVIVDRKMQMVLWFAGLRGAMSFALVEHIPLFDAVTGEGSRFKAELKAMTSASIMFTVFVLGGSTNYFMDYIGLSPAAKRGKTYAPKTEMIPLTRMNGESRCSSRETDSSASGKVLKARRRIRPEDDPEW